MTTTCRRAAPVALFAVFLTASSSFGQTATPVSRGLDWLTSQQTANGTWAAVPELAPRDTSRALMALALHRSTSPAVTNATAWLNSQRGFDANQFLAEQALALSLAGGDALPALDRLTQQRSTTSADYGGFLEHTGTSYDSALALQAFATNETRYLTSIAGVVTTLITRQNADGGWGIDAGFASHPVITSEVLIALSSTGAQQAPPATVAAAQSYLVSRVHADGSIGANVLETALAFRALALSGYALSAIAPPALAYFAAQQSANGSWSNDAYLTARVLEAYSANKPNLAIKDGDFTLSPSQVSDGASVTATVKVSNTGAASPSANSNVKLYVGDTRSREIGAVSFTPLAAGQTRSVTITFSATNLIGTQTITAVVDPDKAVDDLRRDDNDATATLKVAGKPDLQVFSADIVTAPSHLQPNTEGTLNVTIRNSGEGEAANAGYAIYSRIGTGTETLLRKDSVASIAVDGAAAVSLPITLPAGTTTIRVVADPDAQLTETNESNNTASKSISVTTAENVDLRIRAGAVSTNPQRPTAGQSVNIAATIDNAGLARVTSTVAFYDGVPNAGGVVIATLPIAINAQSSVEVQLSHVATATSRVIYAVADPDNLLPEVDETNNAGFALLTDQYADLVLSAEGFVLPRATLANGQRLDARLVVRNNGQLPASGAHVIVYDDLPQVGGIKVLDTTVDVPAMGKVVVPVSWNVRAGQRFAVAQVNDTHSVFEPDYANNRVTKLYTPRGSFSDVRLDGNRAFAIDASALAIDQAALTISGTVAVNITMSNSPFIVTLFEDVDGDLAFNPEIDTALGSTLVTRVDSVQRVVVAAQGTIRFAPGKLVLHLDSSNAIPESDEANNFVDLWQNCQDQSGAFVPGVKWRTNATARNLAPVARFRDTNGDDIVDDNDTPYVVVPTGAAIALHRGDNGQQLWIRNFGHFGRQAQPAIGDLDKDGVPEIIASNYSHRIVAVDVDGNVKWLSAELPIHPDWEPWIFFKDFTYVGAPVIADLEGDGTVEVIVGRAVLNGIDGSIKWIGAGASGRAFHDVGGDLYGQNFPDQEAPITADLNGDGKLEVIAGSTAYRADGTIFWNRSDLADGYTAAVTLPGQTNPSIALVSWGRLTMLKSDGTTLWGPVNLPNGARMGGPPTVFMDYGGGPWVGVAGDGYYTVFNAATGAVRWTKQTTTDFSFGIITTNAATAFDFGSEPMLAYAARHNFYILRSLDGSVLYDMPNDLSVFVPSAPVIADIDGDGRTDIAVPGDGGVKVISDPRWNGTVSVFNQLAYNVVNVANDRASIPTTVTQTSFSKTHFRTNAALPSTATGVTGQPNLSASYMRADTSNFPASVKLSVRIGNNGWLQSVNTTVAFHRLAGTTDTIAGTATVRALRPGEYEDATFTFANPSVDTTAFYAVVDDTTQIRECNESDNRSQNVNVRLTTDITVDPPTALAINDPQPRRGETIELVANADLTAAVNAANVRAQFFLGDPASGGTAISALLPVTVTNEGDRRIANATTTWNVTAPVGPATIVVVFDPLNAIAESDEANNKATAAVTVGESIGQPDLQLFAADINVSPSRLQPGQQATIAVTIRNGGRGDAANVGWAIYDVVGASSTLLGRGTIASMPMGGSEIVTTSAQPSGGTHTIRAVVDPDGAIAESNETNNEAAREVTVSPVSNVDLKVASVTADPSRPTTGQTISIRATVENGGSEDAQANVGFYNGVPGRGGVLIALVPLSVEAQSSATLERTFVVPADAVVVYAFADPDDVLPEIDESNNAGYAVLTDNYTDLAVTRDDIALSAANVAIGQPITATIAIRNVGLVAAANVPVVVYDDAPASGGRIVFDGTVDVGAQGSTALPVSFAVRGGQHFVTVVVNAAQAIVESDVSNNRATRFYTGAGDEPDLALDGSVARDVAIDTAAVSVDPARLFLAGTVRLRLLTPGAKTFTVLVFEDADGDLAYDSEVDSSFGSALVTAGTSPQTVDVPVQGTLRFAPGKLAIYIDSSNAVNEADETNNLIELWQDCRTNGLPRPNLTASYMRIDGSGYPASARLIARIGNNGLLQSASTGVAFYAIRSGAPTLLGRTGVPGLRPGQYADVVFTIANPAADITAVYAVADDTGTSNSLAECNESDNTTNTVPVQFSADVAVLQPMLGVTDPQPRQGDTIEFGAVARLTGAVNASELFAQFFLGDPATSGEAISGLLPVTITSQNDERTAKVSFRWTVTAPPGNHGVYVVFDPANAIAEDAEENNRGIYSLAVSTRDPVRKLSGTITLTPPTAEPGAAVKVEILAKNVGNVTLENVVVEYHVTGGAGSALDGTATIASLPKNSLIALTLGQFTPASNGDYTVAAKASDPNVTLLATPRILKVAPFASAAMEVAPRKVPVSLAFIQAYLRVSRTNTIVVPDDPLVPLIKTHLQSGVDWMTNAVRPEIGNCFRCHVQAQGLAGLESARRVSGVAVDTQMSAALFDNIVNTQNPIPQWGPDGTWHNAFFVTSTTSGAWALAVYGDPVAAERPLTHALDYLTTREDSDGGYTCDDCRVSFNGRETVSMMAMVSFARGFEITHKQLYQNQMALLAKYALAYDYGSQQKNPENAARIAIGLAHMVPLLEEPALKASAESRLREIALFLRGVQNSDGTFGTSTFPDLPVMRTAQCLYALTLTGAKGNDPALRQSILWLLNSQRPEGGWSELRAEFNAPIHWYDESTWAIIALPAAFLRLGQFDVDLNITLPDTSELQTATPMPNRSVAVTGGRQYLWSLRDVSETGEDVYLDIELKGLQHDEVRAATGAASLSYRNPYDDQEVTRNLTVPSVTGIAALDVSVATDKPSYSANANVAIDEVVRNISSTRDGITNDVVIRDANRTNVATVTANESVSGLPPTVFPSWHYAVPVTFTVEYGGTGRVVPISVDFASYLAQLGINESFETHSIRVSTDARPASELYYSFLPSTGRDDAGQLLVTIPDDVAAGSPLALHIWFDTIENGVKPVSMYNVARTGSTPSQGLVSRYWTTDQSRTYWDVRQPEELIPVGPMTYETIVTSTLLGSWQPTQVPADFWFNIWTGAIYVPATGTYRFACDTDDGCWIDIDGTRVVENPGMHGPLWKEGSRDLTAGFHQFKMTFYEANSTHRENIWWAPPGQGWSAMSGSTLYSAMPATSQGAALIGTPLQIEYGSVAPHYVWNTGMTAAGDYTIVATLRQFGTFMASASAPFVITPFAQLSASVSTDKVAYDSGDTVRVTGDVSYATGNVTMTNLSAIVSVLDAGGIVRNDSTTLVPNLIPGQHATARLDWTTGTAAPGSYTAAIVVKEANGTTVATASVPFEIRSTSQTGKGLTGTITAPASQYAGRAVPIEVSVKNDGNDALANAPFSVVVIDTVSGDTDTTFDFTASIASGALHTASFTWQTTTTTPQRVHRTYLVSRVSGTGVPLAQADIQVQPPPYSRITATATSDAAAYECNSAVAVQAVATYEEGDITRTDVTVMVTIADPNGAIVATDEVFAPTFAVGETLRVPLAWNTGASFPGTYTVTVTVHDAEETFASAATTFDIRSSATTGACITGSISGTTVTEGDLLPFAVSVTNDGNAALPNAPFAVLVNGSTLNVSVDAAIGATFVGTVSWNTSGTVPGIYPAKLVSFITGTPITLAETTVEVKQRPFSNVSASVSTNANEYDCNGNVVVTSSVHYDSGNVTRDVIASATITDPNGITVTTSSVSDATFVTGDTLSIPLAWFTGSAMPGTYAVSVEVHDAVTTYATASTTFVVRSSAATGACITGAVSGTTVTEGDSVPFAVSVTNNGNAALANAPFAVIVNDTTLDVSVDAAIGATFTGTVPWNTTGVTPGVYPAKLLSLITGTPVTLAETTVEVKERPFSNMSASISTDANAYDCNEDVIVTATVSYDSGNIARDVIATATITDPNGTTVATRSTSDATFVAGDTLTVPLTWSTGTSTPGTYTISVEVHDATTTYASASGFFAVRSSAATGACLTGTLSGTSVYEDDSLPFAVTITNGGNANLAGAPFGIIVKDTMLHVSVDATIGNTFTGVASWNTAGVAPGVYPAKLVSLITGTPLVLAETTVEVKERPFSKMSASVSTNANAYDCNQNVVVTAAVHYDTGNTTRDVIATATITDPNGTVVATSSLRDATFVMGETLAIPLTWSTGSSTPGVYKVAVEVHDATETYAIASSTFEVRSTAATGACVTGTIVGTSVYQDDSLPFTVTITNNGNANLADAPFAVIVNNTTLDVRVDAAIGGAFIGSVSWNTTGVTTGTHSAKLVALITGTPVTLAETTVEVKERPFSTMSASVSADASAYDCDENVVVAARVKYDAGNVTRDVIAIVTIVAPNGAVVATSSLNDATFAVGDTLTVPLTWGTGSSTPGTYAVAIEIHDANETYATASTSFVLRSSDTTGACITGTITAPESVQQPDTVPFAITITNEGNAALANAPFAVVITHPTTGDVVATLNVSATAEVGATYATTIEWTTATLTPQFYRAQLVSLITGAAVPLAETTVEVKVPPLKLELSLTSPARVLIWADCTNGNSRSTCTPARPAFLTATLDAAGIHWTLVGDQTSFLAALRTGAYDAAILYQKSPYEAKIFAEYAATIHGGVGLLLIKAHPDAVPRLDSALGVTFKGILKASSTTLELLPTPFTTAGTMSVIGDGLKLDLTTATPAARIFATQEPVVTYNAFGTGRVVVLPFDVEKTQTVDMAKLLVGSMHYVARTRSFDARQVVGIDFDVTPPPTGTTDLTVTFALPAGMSIMHASPALTTANSWNITASGSDVHLALWVRLPEEEGTSTVTGTAAFAGQIAAVTKTVDLTVTADRESMEEALQSALSTLASQAAANEQKAVSDAQAQLTAIRTTTNAETAIAKTLVLIGELESITSADVTASRNLADRILAWWQSRAGV